MNYAELCAIIERNRDARRALRRKRRHPATRPEKPSIEAPAPAPAIPVSEETSNPVAPIETPEESGAPAAEAPAPKKKKYHKKKKAVEENTTNDPA